MSDPWGHLARAIGLLFLYGLLTLLGLTLDQLEALGETR